jgi:hypothetical protein
MLLVSLKAQYQPLRWLQLEPRFQMLALPLPPLSVALGSTIANMAIAFGHGTTKKRVREEKGLHEKGDLQRTENSDPRTENCELRTVIVILR